ncbi:MAG: hypothetical protein EOM05_04790 [Clostridia bacterium]|nr:hypothetical protein [Clostridia bacterium]
MKKSELEKRLASEISQEVPDVLDSILSKCEPKGAKIIEFEDHKATDSKTKWLKSAFATAAMFVLIVGGYFGFGQYQSNIVESVVLLDVNPSVELKVNKNEKIISAQGLNKDGVTVIDKIESDGKSLKGEELDITVEYLINTMVKEGFISEQSGSVLVSVENDDDKKNEKVKSHLMITIHNTLKENGIEGAIMGQSSSKSEKISKLATKYKIDKGKAELIEKIVAKNPQLTFEQLVKLSISDLSLLVEGSDDITIVGFNAKGYVSSEAAVDSACAHANVALGDAKVGVSFEVSDGKLTYDVLVTAGNNRTDYKIDVKTGEILTCAVATISDSVQNSVQESQSGNIVENDTKVPQVSQNDIIDGAIDEVSGEVDKAKSEVRDEVMDEVMDEFFDEIFG